MAFETIQGTLRQTRLTNESADYRARREELRLAEIDLMQRREHVAELRRRLPLGATVQDYVFQEGRAGTRYAEQVMIYPLIVLANDVQVGSRQQVMDVGDATGNRILDRDHRQCRAALVHGGDGIFERPTR